MRPDKTPFLEYYLAPLLVFAYNAITQGERLYRRLAGRWYCEYCRQYHSRRTKRYYSICTWIRTSGCSLSEFGPRKEKKQ